MLFSFWTTVLYQILMLPIRKSNQWSHGQQSYFYKATFRESLPANIFSLDMILLEGSLTLLEAECPIKAHRLASIIFLMNQGGKMQSGPMGRVLINKSWIGNWVNNPLLSYPCLFCLWSKCRWYLFSSSHRSC